MSMGPLVKGMAAGITVGAITYAMTNTSSKQKRKLKRSACKMIGKACSVVDGICCMMK